MQTVYLTGGGPGAFAPLRRNFGKAIAELGIAKPLVAYVGAASGDDRGFFEMITGGLAKKARFEMAKTAGRASPDAARAVLEDCDLVFMSGGDVHRGMQALAKKGIDETLRALAKKGKPMFGVSAGSLLLAREWVKFDDHDEAHARIFPCLGIAPLHVDAHSEEDDWSELRVLVRLLAKRGDPKPVGYGLTRNGGLRLRLGGGGKKPAMRPIGSAIPRLVVKRGEVVHASPLAPR